jgi:multimeric flavodoxin WrbA
MTPPQGAGRCSIKDDMVEILEQMKGTDAFIFGTPNHMRTVTAPLLNFFARMLPLLEFLSECDDKGQVIGGEFSSKLRDKKAATVITQGDPFFSSPLVYEVLERNLIDFKIRRIGDVISISNMKKGAVANKEEDLKKAYDLGVKLATMSGLA